jgi:copper transport protein
VAARLRGTAAALLFLALTTTSAFAHATLLRSEPPANALLQTSPAVVSLIFNEPVRLLAATLVTDDGASHPLPADGISGAILVLPMPLPLAGSTVLSWRAVSDDGHPISGAVVFAVGERTAVAATEAGDPLVPPLLWFGRVVMFAGLFLGAAGAAYRTIAPALPAPARTASLALVAVGLVAAPISLGLHGLDALGRPLSDFFRPEVWHSAFATSYGPTVAVALGALLLGGISVVLPSPRVAAFIGIIATIGIGLAASLSGHASAAEPQWITRPAVFAHTASISWWIGTLFPLALILGADRGQLAPPLIRFSRIIPVPIAALIGSGLILGIVQLGWPGQAWLTPYGYILIAKLVLLAILFAIAGWNRWALTAPAVRGDKRAADHMRRMISFELLLVLVIFGLVAGWRFTAPPRALTMAIEQQTHIEVALADKGVEARIVVTAGAATVRLTTPASTPPTSVTLQLLRPELGIEPIRLSGTVQPDGRWLMTLPDLPAGEWQLRLDVRVTDFQLVRLAGEITLE